eukprot:11913552-Ditylum_brightwellii.AAC.1
MSNPITMLNIQQHQFKYLPLNNMRRQNPHRFPVKEIEGRFLICYRDEMNDPMGLWCIALPSKLVVPVIIWYHHVLGHCGINQLDCQRNKVFGAGFGELPAWHAALMLWSKNVIDLIRPWRINIRGEEVEFNALTCINMVSNVVEMIRVENKNAEHVAQQYENCWLSCYPCPVKCIHDNGGKFIGEVFQIILQRNGINDSPTTYCNPQANAVCERLHQTVANILRTTTNNKANNYQQAVRAVDDALTTAMHAAQCTVSQTLNTSPVIADLITIRDRRQHLIDENLCRQNLKRKEYDYMVGHEVLIKAVNPTKLEPKAHGPYKRGGVQCMALITGLKDQSD